MAAHASNCSTAGHGSGHPHLISHEFYCLAWLFITVLDGTQYHAAYDSDGRSASGPWITPSSVARVAEVGRR